jgi:hypothetical protein
MPLNGHARQERATEIYRPKARSGPSSARMKVVRARELAPAAGTLPRAPEERRRAKGDGRRDRNRGDRLRSGGAGR